MLVRISDLDIGNTDDMQLLKSLSIDFDTYDSRPRNEGRSSGIHASELSPCLRRLVYNLTGVEQKSSVPLHLRRIFDTGHAIHGMFQEKFHHMAKNSKGRMAFEDEVKIKPGKQELATLYEIHSSCDGVFTFFDDAGNTQARLVLEIKTISPTEFDKLTKPKKEHIEQAHLYMKCLDIPYCWFLYYNKGNQNITPTTNSNFLIKFNPATWAGIEAKLIAAHDHAAAGTLPERTETQTCTFCAFAEVCKPKSANFSAPIHARWMK